MTATTESQDHDPFGQHIQTPDGGPETISFTFQGEEFTVSGFERTLPDPSTPGDRAQLVKAGLNADGAALDEDAWHAVARAIISPEAAAAQLRSAKGQASALIEEHVEGATLRSLHTRVWLTELFPGHQPRTGQGALPVEDPEVHGDVDDHGRPYARVVYRYRDRKHLHDHLAQTIEQTRHANPNPYDRSILARRITRAVIAHPCRLEFADGDEHMDVLAVRDGITRLTSAWALLTDATEGSTPYADEIAATALRILTAEKTQRRGSNEKSLSQRMALGRQDALTGLLAEFQRGVTQEQPADRSVRIGQTLVVPAQITVGIHRHGSAGLSAEEVFDDAVRSILASIHVEFRHWEAAAQNVEVGSRAISRVRLPGLPQNSLLEGIIGLALGRRKPEDLPAVFGRPDIPGTPLWRAVYLTHFLTRPEVFEQVKKFAKDIKGTSQMKTSGYAELLGPVIDLPWRGYKAGSLQQARNAWANGGVLTKQVLGDWQPTPTADFTDLVEPALKGNKDARQTLAVAGGTALIADKLITRNVGSAVGKTVPFRANTDQIVAGLAQSEEGLWSLAFAARAFEAKRECLNSFTDAQLLARNTADMYTIPAVDLSAPDKIARDAGGRAVRPLDQWRVVAVSNPGKAQQAEQERQQQDHDADNEPSVAQKLAAERRALRHAVAEAGHAVDRLLKIADSPEARATTVHPFGSQEELDRMIAEVRQLVGRITLHPQAADEEEWENEENEENDGDEEYTD
ncbi:hypothetical protein [Streptomyces sp. A012304]|uniref:hypothetical protein n=1 Tax=Streptomyces sp. A012304 TaxID=375446 RepID=UPI0022320DD8|nr:hypothetical protein [Streptomyces sp. A012304]GKQ38143.1 hypothetical protein ALMP_46770 [Streptomyces sp. A012304]